MIKLFLLMVQELKQMPIDIHLYGKKNIHNHESKVNEDSKTLYHELVENRIISEIKEDYDNELTKEEIDLISSHLNQHINN